MPILPPALRTSNERHYVDRRFADFVLGVVLRIATGSLAASSDSMKLTDHSVTSQDTTNSTPATRTTILHRLVIVHLVVGIAVAIVMSTIDRRSGPPFRLVAAFLGIIFGQASLLGIWASLGTTHWRRRLIGTVLGVSYLILLFGTIDYGLHSRHLRHMIGVAAFLSAITLVVWTIRVAMHLDASALSSSGRSRLSFCDLFVLAFALIWLGDVFWGGLPRGIPVPLSATCCTMIVLLIPRSMRIAIHRISAPAASVVRIQFAIRHLMLLTFVIACLITVGRLLPRYIWNGQMLVVGLTFGLVGIIPIWPALSPQRSTILCLVSLALAGSAGIAIGHFAMCALFRYNQMWWTVTMDQTIVVALSLLVVRLAGYRLKRSPLRE